MASAEQLDTESGATLRGRSFGADRLPDSHPAAQYRGVFTEYSAAATELSREVLDFSASWSRAPLTALALRANVVSNTISPHHTGETLSQAPESALEFNIELRWSDQDLMAT